MSEEPIVETPEVEAPAEVAPEVKPEETGQIDLDGIISQLETVGVKNPQDLENMHIASQQSGNIANLLGEQRKENEALRDEMSKLRETVLQPTPVANEYGYDQPQQLTAKDVAKVVSDTLDASETKKLKAQRDLETSVQNDLAAVNNDRFFNTVKENWETAQNDPEAVARVRSRQTSALDEYRRVKDDTLEKLLTDITAALKQTQEQGKVKPPHMESGNGSPPAAENYDNSDEALKKIRDNSSGTDADYVSAMKALFPSTQQPG